jgi:hypothetical protein
MQHPLSLIPSKGRRPIFSLLLLLTALTIGGMQGVSGPLSTEAAPAGIISYEFAGDVPNAQAILDSWDAAVRVRVGLNLGLDFLFLVLYSTAIACACAWIAGALPAAAASLGIALAWGQWLAALLDAVENIALLNILLSAPASPWPQIARLCAVFKFALVFLGLLYALMGSIWLVWTARRRPGTIEPSNAIE